MPLGSPLLGQWIQDMPVIISRALEPDQFVIIDRNLLMAQSTWDKVYARMEADRKRWQALTFLHRLVMGGAR